MTQRTRVLHVVTRFIDGGSERRVEDMVEALESPRFEHEVAVGPEADLDRLSAIPRIRRAHLVPELRRDLGVGDARGFSQLRRVLADGEYDLLHTCQSKAGILGRLASIGVPGLRRVHSATMATFGEGFPARTNLYLAAERLAAPLTDLYLVAGTSLRDRYVQAGVAPERRFRVMRASIDIPRFVRAGEQRDAHRRRLGLAEGQPVLAVVGSLSARKGAQHLADLARLAGALVDPAAVVLVAGAGPLEAVLRSSAQAAVGRLRILGHRTDVEAVIASADVVVSLSTAEGLSQSLVQAVASRRPIVTYPMDGTRELLSMGAVGEIVTRRDPALIAKAAAALIGTNGPRLDLTEFGRDAVLAGYRQALLPLLDASGTA